MTVSIEIQAKSRSDLDMGKGASRRLRRLADNIPGILYGGGKDPQPLTLAHNKIMQATENKDFYSTILTLELDGTKEPVIVKAIQRHPSQRRILHLDLQRVADNEKIIVHIPVRITGAAQSPGARMAGRPKQLMNIVKVTCLPKDLPEILEADAKAIGLAQALYMSDLKLPEGVELVADLRDRNQNLPIFRMIAPKAAKAAK